jgi:hypothetical protein
VLELVTTASIITILVFYASRHFRSQGSPFVFDSTGWYEEYLATSDLPCPWCHAPTREVDQACPSCERAFGAPVSG